MAQETIAAVEKIPPAERTSKQLHALEQALRLVPRADRVAPRKPPRKPSSGVSDRLAALIAHSETSHAQEAGLPCAPHEPWDHASGPRCRRCGEALDEETAERCIAEQRAVVTAMCKRLGRKEGTRLTELRFELGERWREAGSARPRKFEQQWRKAATDDERRAVLQRERAELEALEDLGATAPRPR